MIMLSILMPTIPERKERFDRLFNQVLAQTESVHKTHPSLGRVQILRDDSPRFLDGGLSVGKKREALVKRAEGRYLCFLDDDDSIAPNYVESLLRLCNQGQDVCTFQAMVKLNDFWALVDMRLSYLVNDQINPNYTVRRPPWHICPVISNFAKEFSFNDKNNAEDFEWMQKVLSRCVSEAHSEKILFQYNHGSHSEVDKIPLP